MKWFFYRVGNIKFRETIKKKKKKIISFEERETN